MKVLPEDRGVTLTGGSDYIFVQPREASGFATIGRMKPSGSVLLLFVAATLLASCGKSTEAVIQERRAAVEGRLAAFQAVADQLGSEVAPTGAPFVLAGPPPQFGPMTGGPNAVVMETAHFQVSDPLPPGLHLCLENPIADASSLMKSGEFHGGRPGNRELKEQYLRNFLAVRYVLVIRSLEVREPVVQPGRPSPPPDRNRPLQELPKGVFTKGTCEGDAILFDLDQKKSVGGFRFFGESSSNLTVSTADEQGYLRSDLRINTVRGICREFGLRYPGATPPFDKE
jgi:hypothetical protein